MGLDNIFEKIDAVKEEPKTFLDNIMDKIDAVDSKDPLDKINDDIKLQQDIAAY